MNKKTYIVEENQIRLKPDVEKPTMPDKKWYMGNDAVYDNDIHHYEGNYAIWQEAYNNSPAYQKSGDWSGYAEGQEISEDEVEIHTEWSNETLMIMEGNGDNPKDFPYEPIAIPKKKPAPATGQGMGEGEIIKEAREFDEYLLQIAQDLNVYVDFSNKGYDGDKQAPLDRYGFIDYLRFGAKESTPQGSGQGMKWVKHLGQRIIFGYKGRKKEGIIEGYHPLYGVVVFVPSNVFLPHHYVKEDLIEWPESSPQERSDKEIEELAEKMWDKWALKHEDHIYMTKDLFTLAIQDPAMIEMYKQKEDTP